MPAVRSMAVAAFLLVCVVLPPDATAESSAEASPDPDRVERWDEVREDLLADPLDPFTATVSDLTVLPGLSDSAAARLIHLARTDPGALPPDFRDVFRVPSTASLDARLRAYTPDPQDSNRWRRSGTSLRILTLYGDAWSAAVLLERDASEPGVVDHTGITATYKSSSRPLSVVVGQYRLHVGNGLVAGRYGSLWIDYGAFRNGSPGVTGTVAATESGALMGVATEARFGRMHVLGAVARPSWDAALSDSGVVTTLRTSGTHVTQGELDGKDALSERFGLMRIGVDVAPNVAAGVTVAAAEFSHPVDFAPPVAAPESRLAWYGLDAAWTGERVVASAEGAMRESGAWAGSALSRYRQGPVEILGAVWSYDPDYAAPHAGTWSFRSDPQDESALVGGARYRFDNASFELLVARYSQDHLSGSNIQPREGIWEQARIEWRASSLLGMDGRWRRTSSRLPGSGGSGDESRTEYRIVADLGPREIGARLRGDLVVAEPEGRGALGVLYTRMSRGVLSLRAHVAVFRVTDSDATVYVYEPRARSYGVIRGLTGTGVAWGGLAGITTRWVDGSLSATGVSRRGEDPSTTVAAQIRFHVE